MKFIQIMIQTNFLLQNELVSFNTAKLIQSAKTNYADISKSFLYSLNIMGVYGGGNFLHISCVVCQVHLIVTCIGSL